MEIDSPNVGLAGLLLIRDGELTSLASFCEAAPVIVAACANPKQSGMKGDQSYYLLDIGIAMEHLVLAAAEQGLGTCWVGWFDEKKARKALGAPASIRVVACTPLGFPDETPEQRPRKALGEIVRRDQWA